MGIWTFLLIVMGGLLAIHIVFIPRVRRRLVSADPSPQAMISTVCALAVLRQLRVVAAITAAASLVVIVLVEGAALAGRAFSITSLGAYLAHLRAMNGSLGTVENGTATIAVLALGLMLIVLVRRNARKKVSLLFQRAQEQQSQELMQRYVDGTLEERPPNEAMRALEQDLTKTLEAGDALDDAIANGAVDEERGRGLRAQIDTLLESLQTRYVAADVARRVRVKLDPNQVAEPEPVTFAARVKTIFISRGLVTSLGGVSRALYFATLLLLVPSLLAFGAGPANATLTTRIVSLDQLRVSRSVEAAEREYNESVSQIAVAAEPTMPESSVVDQVARAFEDASFTLPGRSIGSSVVSAIARREILDLAVANDASGRLSRSATLAEGPQVEESVARALRDFERLERTPGPRTGIGRRFRADLIEELRTRPGLRLRMQEIGASFLRPANTDDVTRLLLREAIGGALEGSASIDRSLSPLVRVISDAVDTDLRRAYGVQRHIFLAQLASGGTLEEAQAAVQLAELRYPRWTNAAIQRLDGIVKERFPGGTDVLEHYQPALQRAVDPAVDMRSAVATTRDMARRAPSSAASLEQITESLVTYDDWFPAQHGADTRTARGALLAELDPETFRAPSPSNPRARMEPLVENPERTASTRPAGGNGRLKHTPAPANSPQILKGPARGAALLSEEGRLAEDVAQRVGQVTGTIEPSFAGTGGTGGTGGMGSLGGTAGTNVATPATTTRAHGVGRPVSAATRARSFGRLRGFARVGGVLIGRPADDTSRPANFRDLAWRLDGRSVILSFVGAKGDTVRLPPYRASLVYRALVYAADGRPAAVTMVTASPLADLKVLLHPALIDTPLGCATTELDRLVDIYSGADEGEISRARKDASTFVYESDALYKLAWAERVELNPNVASEVGEMAEELLSDGQADSLAAAALAKSTKFDSLHTPVVGSPAFYDVSLVDIMKPCVRTSADIASYRACVRFALGTPASDAATVSRISALPPQFTIWSGVRERSFAVDSTLRFARRTSANSPLQFMLQVAFTSSAEFGGDETIPWEFPGLGASIERAVRHGIVRDRVSGHARIVADLEEFTHLQRLFRLALGHQLGRDFPVSRLVQLTQATRPFGQAVAQTPRWNPKATWLEVAYLRQARRAAAVLEQVATEMTSIAPSIRTVANTFATFVVDCVNRLSQSVQLERFEQVCSMADASHPVQRAYAAARASSESPGTEEKQLLDFIGRQVSANEDVLQARRLRRVLQVDRDQRASVPCPHIS